ncbi:hypothetical protein [Pseudomonas sp. SO81]|uniref:hypothetical protein n=1 Tax=Pseudomonas sp. SO81 TaxID=2983246 RepID=UPI0025A3AE25|nr:hypothetical protein [Pseudomonas sp. SO81]WJN60902.1 hypothetical protein OH686_19330 [Pseudomonas sp. SO81]
MIQQPHFRSHADQLAALGSAAQLDPAKYPRRAALARAREKQMATRRGHGDKFRQARDELASGIKMQATTMTLAEISRATGIDRKRLNLIAEENGFTFLSRPQIEQARMAKIARAFLEEEPQDGG